MRLTGADAADFIVDTNSGVINFAAIPDWDSPVDADTDNIYNFTITATNTAGGTAEQSVKIFVYPKNDIIGTEIAQQIGSDIDGEADEDWFGYSVSLSADGKVLAIGARYNDGNSSDLGHVRVYENSNGIWTQIGADIDGEAVNDQSGFSVSLSADGKVVAIGARSNDGNGSDSGHVRVYENSNGTWTQVGTDIDAEASLDQSGFSVSLSADGKVVAIGARYNNGNGSDSGHVRVYENNDGI